MLGVEHSTVSRRISQLEEALSLRLFDRLARGWALTDEGQGLLHHAEQVEQDIFSFRRVASGIDPLFGTVRISAPPVILNHYILNNLHDLHSQHPGLIPELIGERRDADLIRAEVDIAIRLGEPGVDDLVMQPLGTISYGFYTHEDKADCTAQEHVFIGFDDSMPDLPQRRWVEAEAAGRPVVLRSNDMMTMLHAAQNGYGVALLPDFLVRKYANLTRLETKSGPFLRPLFLVMHPDVRRSQRVRLVADRLAASIKAMLKQETPPE